MFSFDVILLPLQMTPKDSIQRKSLYRWINLASVSNDHTALIEEIVFYYLVFILSLLSISFHMKIVSLTLVRMSIFLWKHIFTSFENIIHHSVHFIATVNTGAFDNLVELSSIACAEKLWFHVDGAFGSFVVFDPQRRHLV